MNNAQKIISNWRYYSLEKYGYVSYELIITPLLIIS